MNCSDYEEFRKNIKTLNDDHLLSLQSWLDAKVSEKDRVEKIELINLELERRYKMRRFYENFS